ncbi:hypothetical protein P280DRAFT_320324 [Massarina eburnea CBS 473.64]|uniref:Uncharacterized protein n=1 Tax=Massarina eburnea CBS 473.64 TaxID=1395130 RepID=A0A6A6RY73_9PLEO|nr:hypothetical protein P280DRAFT_320324 [Massarina eburnea CBS 473.64]
MSLCTIIPTQPTYQSIDLLSPLSSSPAARDYLIDTESFLSIAHLQYHINLDSKVPYPIPASCISSKHHHYHHHHHHHPVIHRITFLAHISRTLLYNTKENPAIAYLITHSTAGPRFNTSPHAQSPSPVQIACRYGPRLWAWKGIGYLDFSSRRRGKGKGKGKGKGRNN